MEVQTLKKKRISRYKRTDNTPRMYLTARDKEIIIAVYRHRLLRRDQIDRLFFTQISACNRRLFLLYHHGYLDRIFKPVSFGSSQAVYALDKNGADLIAQELGIERSKINWKRKNNNVELLFLEHTLAISEFYVNLVLSLRKQPDIKLLFWQRESKEINDRVPDPSGKRKYLTVSPDAFFGIKRPEGKSYFFIEVDMGTMSVQRYKRKIIAYRQYWKNEKYREAYGFRSFRVITVTNSNKRLKNLQEECYNAGGRNMFMFFLWKDLDPGFL